MVVLEGLQKEIGSSVAVIENKLRKARCGLRRSIYTKRVYKQWHIIPVPGKLVYTFSRLDNGHPSGNA